MQPQFFQEIRADKASVRIFVIMHDERDDFGPSGQSWYKITDIPCRAELAGIHRDPRDTMQFPLRIRRIWVAQAFDTHPVVCRKAAMPLHESIGYPAHG